MLPNGVYRGPHDAEVHFGHIAMRFTVVVLGVESSLMKPEEIINSVLDAFNTKRGICIITTDGMTHQGLGVEEIHLST